MRIPTLAIEKKLGQKGFKDILGMDEAGRGPLAGPLVCAGVLYTSNKEKGFNSKLIRDSKTLSEKQRETAYKILGENKIRGAYAIISNQYIDAYGMTKSLERGYSLVREKIDYDYILLDGNYSYGLENNHTTIVNGDSTSKVIAAASIVAKCIRDKIMVEASKKYPEYNFDTHKGYGTKKHFKAIDEFGVCALHRKTFLKNRLKVESLS